MKVQVRFKATSQAKVFENVTNTYVKAGFYCIFIEDQNKVIKYPVINIFDVQESYC